MNLRMKLDYAIIAFVILTLAATSYGANTDENGNFNTQIGNGQNPILTLIGTSNSQTQQQSTFPQAYEESLLPPQVNVGLNVRGQIYTDPSKELLRGLYGDDYKQSNYWQTRKQLSKDNKFTRYIHSLQETRNKDVNVMVHYDDPKRLIPGETFTNYDSATSSWKTYTVNKGDSVAVVAQNLNLSEDDFIKNNTSRFNIHPHARWSNSTVHLSETRPLSKKDLRGLLAHEVTHTVDGTCGVGNYEMGPDGKHYIDEYTNRSTAWQEGLADYTGGLFAPWFKNESLKTVNNIRMETRESTADDPIMENLFDPSYNTRIGTEGVVANVLTALDGRGANRQNILDTVKAGNQNWQNGSLADRNIETFTTSYIAQNPDQVSRSLMALDLATGFTADEDKLRQLAGNVDPSEYLANRAQIRMLQSEYSFQNPEANIFDFYNKFDKQNFPNKLDKLAEKNGLKVFEPMAPPAEGTPMESVEIFGIKVNVPKGSFKGVAP